MSELLSTAALLIALVAVFFSLLARREARFVRDGARLVTNLADYLAAATRRIESDRENASRPPEGPDEDEITSMAGAPAALFSRRPR